MICTRATAESMAYDDAFAAAPARRAARPGPARGSSTSSRRASPAATSCSTSPTSTSTRWSRPASTPWSSAAPTTRCSPASSRYVMGDGVTLVSQRRGVRQGRLQDARAHRPDARRAASRPTPSPPPARPDEFETHRAPVPRPRARSRAIPVRRAACAMRLTVVGCSGSYPGPDSPASCYLLEADARRAAPGGSCSTSATARSARCTGTPTRWPIDAVFLSHLHADHCLDLCGYYVMRKYHPTGPQPRIPVWGPAGTADRMARAYDLPTDPGMTEEFDFRDARAAPVELGPFLVEPRRSCTRSRPSRCGSPPAAARSPTPATPGRATALDAVAARRRPVARRGVVPRRRRQPARPAPDRRRVRHDGHRGRRRPAGAHPHPAVARPRAVAEAEARGEWTGRLDAGARRARRTRSEASVRPGPASWTTIAICTRLVTASLSKSRDTCALTVGTDR